jgi:hypothetical protein
MGPLGLPEQAATEGPTTSSSCVFQLLGALSEHSAHNLHEAAPHPPNLTPASTSASLGRRVGHSLFPFCR